MNKKIVVLILFIAVLAGLYFFGSYNENKEKTDYVLSRTAWCRETFESQKRRDDRTVDHKYISLTDACQVFYKYKEKPLLEECQNSFNIHTSNVNYRDVYTGEQRVNTSMLERAQLDLELCLDGLFVKIF